MYDFSIQYLYKYDLGACIQLLLASRLWADVLGFSLKSQENAQSESCSEHNDIRHAQNGNRDAFRRVIECHQSHVSKLLWRFTRDKNTHEDLVQECFVQTYLSLHTYKARAPFEHWISRIATRVGYRYWKQCKRNTHISLTDNDWEHISGEQADPTDPPQAAELVHTLLAKLPPRDRLVLTLRYLEQCSVKETAQRTGWTLALVKVQTHRAIQKLRKLLEHSDIEFEV